VNGVDTRSIQAYLVTVP